jgi:hypothetical protein
MRVISAVGKWTAYHLLFSHEERERFKVPAHAASKAGSCGKKGTPGEFEDGRGTLRRLAI